MSLICILLTLASNLFGTQTHRKKLLNGAPIPLYNTYLVLPGLESGPYFWFDQPKPTANFQTFYHIFRFRNINSSGMQLNGAPPPLYNTHIQSYLITLSNNGLIFGLKCHIAFHILSIFKHSTLTSDFGIKTHREKHKKQFPHASSTTLIYSRTVLRL